MAWCLCNATTCSCENIGSNTKKILINMNKYLKEVIWFFAPIFCSITTSILFFDFHTPYLFFQSIHLFMELWKGFILVTLLFFLLFYIYRMVSKKFENLITNSILLVVNLICVVVLIYFANFFYNPNIGLGYSDPSASYMKESEAKLAFWVTTILVFCLMIFEIFVINKTIKKMKIQSA
ncbi:membrane hypothetical protein [Flavobacterium sp. 9AF]|nr:membrane hypothetical protein [Flavobacterium sp. 9AF]